MAVTPNLHKHLWAIAILIAAALVLGAYINSHGNVIRAEQVKSDVQQQIGAMRDELKDDLAQIAKDKQQTKTPQEIVRVIPQYVQLPSPPQVAPPIASAVGSEGARGLPDAPSGLQKQAGDQVLQPTENQGVYFPKEDVKPLFDRLADAKACDLKLAECQKEVPLLEQRAKAAEKAMNGGGFFSKLKSNSKWFVIGGGAAAGLLCGTGHCR